ncbi:MAG: transcription-repair coupling factor [Burkholderiales bacterium]
MHPSLFCLSVPAPGERLRAGGLHGSSDALYLAQAAAQARPLVVITATAHHAQRLKEEIPFFATHLRVALLPDWETLPYDQFSPHQDLVSERLATLHQVSNDGCDVVLIPVTTALCRLPPKQYLAAYTFFLRQGEKLSLRNLRGQLTLASYTYVTQVLSPGEYSFRGGLIDLFPMGSVLPYRIDLLDDEIDSIRTFDVDSQRSIYKVNEIRLLPAREFPMDEAGQTRFRQSFRERFEGDPSRSQLYKDVSKGLAPAGIEYYLPLFFDETAVFTDYLPAGATICLHGDIEGAALQFWRDTDARYGMLKGDRTRPVLPPQDLYLRPDAFFGTVKAFPRIEVSTHGFESSGALAVALPDVQVDRRANNPLSKLDTFLKTSDSRTLILAESLGRRETMLAYLAEYGLHPAVCETFEDFLAAADPVMLAVAPVLNGFALPAARISVVTEAELYPSVARTRTGREAGRRTTTEGMLRDLSEVKLGDPVVHEQHGVGRYRGLLNLDLGDGETEFLLLEYEGGDKLYVPVAQLFLVSRYSGGPPETAPLHKLGSDQWDKAKRKAAAQVRDTAAELLNLYAQRAARQGHAFALSVHDYEAFAEGFPFEETPDQQAAIEAVLGDLQQGRPMDRLVCGDVGFGKTEVAMRAAFVAVSEGRQVAVLVPTTLLAEQHFNNFSDRFAEWPVKLTELSRFRSAKETAEALKALAEGRLDIVIGTHKLLQKDVRFRNLGLVIIDEEHRFGVRQKERLKALRAEVDVLTLTATPIPRTLAMSLEGLRDFSVISTAPQRRLAIKTFVAPWSPSIVREAVLRELKRGGQVYFVHNEIETIHAMDEKMKLLLPEATIRVAHGQMRERELEHAMRDFHQQRFNVLLCTTIIETGIDVPNANTIVINRADMFGLAQLHQLRGRVGRSHHQAYAFLFTPDEGAVTAQARKRLEAVQMMEELGAGFFLAMHDLEIRGAGEVLGDSQSGDMQAIGFTLFADMLASAVRSLKEGREPDLTAPLSVAAEVNLHAPALLPTDYCPDVHERLVLYKRLANCDTLDELHLLQEELVDRFGLLPPQGRNLLDSHRLRILGKPLGVARIDATADAITIQFMKNTPIDPARIIQLIQSGKGYRLSGPEKLRVEAELPTEAARAQRIREIFAELGAKTSERVAMH